MLTEYKITTKSKYQNFLKIIILIITSIILCAFIYIKAGSDAGIFVTIFMALYVLITFILLSLLHENYRNANEDDELTYDSESERFTYMHQGNIIYFEKDEIKDIVHYLSYPLKRSANGSGSLLWDTYSYCKITLTDNRSLIITSLLIPKLKKFIESIGIDEDKLTEIPSFYDRFVDNKSD